ncbi:MAG: hypothetical protein ACLFPE_11390 [Bacteroidales bacterium]
MATILLGLASVDDATSMYSKCCGDNTAKQTSLACGSPMRELAE